MIKNTHVISGVHQKPIVLDVSYLKNNAPKPIVVFCHGYKGFKDWGCWNNMAETLARAGVFFLKFNFSHNGGTVEQPIDFPDLEAFGHNNFIKELDDLESVISWISKPNNPYKLDVNTRDIILIGHSRGGGIVTIKASENPKITKLINLAGVSDYKSRFPVGDALAHWKKEGVAYIENTRTKQKMPHYFQFHTNFFENEERLTISKAAKKLNIPHLVIHGTADETVPFKEAEKLHSWSKNSRLISLANANHVLGGSHPWNTTTLPEDLNKAINEILAFIA